MALLSKPYFLKPHVSAETSKTQAALAGSLSIPSSSGFNFDTFEVSDLFLASSTSVPLLGV